MLLFLSVLFFFGALGCTFSPTAKIMIVCRFFLGLAVGGAATTVPIYLAEMAPTERRGRMVTQGELKPRSYNACHRELFESLSNSR